MSGSSNMLIPVQETLLFLTRLAWKSKVTLPILVTAVLLAVDFRVQIEINYQSNGMRFMDEVESVEGEEEEVDNPEDAELTIDDDTDDTDIYTDITDNELDNFDDDNDSAPRNEYVIGVRRISGNATTR